MTNALKQYLDLYDKHRATIDDHAPALLNALRPEARAALQDASLPGKNNTSHPEISINDMFAPDFGVNISRLKLNTDLAAAFHCGVPNISTLAAFVDGDSFISTSSLERNLPHGLTVCSLSHAASVMPNLVERYLSKAASGSNPAVALNTLLLQDGVFIHVDSGVKIEKPIQIINLFSASAAMMATRRIIVALEPGASASVVVCDHSSRPDVDYLSNQVVELFLGSRSTLEYYEMEESSTLTRRLNHVFARQQADSSLIINASTLTCGLSLSTLSVCSEGDRTDCHLGGLAIATYSQRVGIVTDVRHSHLSGRSRQMFKYVASDSAVASFYGIIKVDEEAKFTQAYQTNRNILSSPTAKIFTRPQLEIYCDEVKCSHGATIGSIDRNALFYMRSRGIPETQARLMLMQAFMAEIIDAIRLPALSQRLHHLVERRLSGETIQCADCRAK